MMKEVSKRREQRREAMAKAQVEMDEDELGALDRFFDEPKRKSDKMQLTETMKKERNNKQKK